MNIIRFMMPVTMVIKPIQSLLQVSGKLSLKTLIIQYNEVARTKLFDADGTAFDTDLGTGGTIYFQYNYSHGNEGGFWLDCAHITPNGYIKTVLKI